MTYLSSSGCGYGGCASYSTVGGGYSSLESRVSYSAPASSGSYNSNIYTMEAAPLETINLDKPIQTLPSVIPRLYKEVGYSNGYSVPQQKDYFVAEPFLNNSRPSTKFVGSADEIKHYIKEIFEKTTGTELPNDIIINVVDGETLKQQHVEFGGKWNPAIQGFSVNKRGFGQSLIIVKKNDLDKLLITIGHEIGHVMSFSLNNKLSEEAKAFAFEMAWIKTIHEENIAGLSSSINLSPRPAKNGLHNIAFTFVLNQMQAGNDSMNIFNDLVHGKTKLEVGI